MKKFDFTVLISIILIAIMLILFVLAATLESGCRGQVVACQTFLQSFYQLFGGVVYAYALPTVSKVDALESYTWGAAGIAIPVARAWGLFLILYPIIKYICLSLKMKVSARDIKSQKYDDYESKKKEIKFIVKRNAILAVIVFFCSTLLGITQNLAKPIIYIYPERETTVQVSVGYPEKLSCVYPEYTEDGWKVIAKPNGDLVDIKTGRNLYCLYWEGNNKLEYKFKDGFVVAGEDSAKFLEEKLSILGLNEREANEFIIYWLPKLEANEYNLIRFETAEEIEAYMPLNIEPKPDTLIRVVMDFKGLNRPIEVEEQKLETPVREGYTVVEWGGSEF